MRWQAGACVARTVALNWCESITESIRSQGLQVST